MSKDKEVEVTLQGLLNREVRPIHNWHEWLLCWGKAENFQYMESLLHVGFNVPVGGEKEYDSIDRYIFYFTIADGWSGKGYMEESLTYEKKHIVGFNLNQNPIQKTEGKLRQQLALKAFNILCQNFFKVGSVQMVRGVYEFNRVWEDAVVSERLFPVIQNFFKVEGICFGEYAKIRNLSERYVKRSHNEELVVEFLLNLAKFLWTWKEGSTRWYGDKKEEADKRLAETRVRIESAKPWMVEVLVRLDKLDVLQDWILELDELCLDKLKEISLRNELSWEHPGRYGRVVTTIDEACYVGSKTAWFLKKHELMTREHKRLVEIHEVRIVAERSEPEFKELTSKK